MCCNHKHSTIMERSRSFSNSWSDRGKSPRIATVKPVSKSFSEDDLLKATGEDHPRIPERVFSRLKVQDISLLKKDSIISELEKCLLELETEHGYGQHLGDVYEKVETERNQLLDELDMAFQDLQLYMQKQKVIEDEKASIEYDREELSKENEYLKAVLSNRNEIINNKLKEENRQYQERVKELELKNTQHLDEINELYEERQTLINSLLNLQSSAVDDVIRKTSRSSSLCSRESSDDSDFTNNSNQVKDLIDQIGEGNIDLEACKKTLTAFCIENEELKDAFKRIRKERDTAESEIDSLREENDHIDQMYAEKIREYQLLQEDRNEKNLNLSKLNLEKRTLQRQYDHMRESNRVLNGKVSTLAQDLDNLRECKHKNAPAVKEANSSKLENVESGVSEKINVMKCECKDLKASKENLENQLKIKAESASNLNVKYEIALNENKTLREAEESLKKELNDLKNASSEKHKDLVVELDNVRNKNQQLQHAIEKVHSERENIKSELSNYKSDVIEKIKENLDTFEQERMLILSHDESLHISALQGSDEKIEDAYFESFKQIEEPPKSRSSFSDIDDNTIRKYDVLKKDYDRVLLKCRQLEKSSADYAGLDAETKRLNDVNEMLLQRYRSLESDYNGLLNETQNKNKSCLDILDKYDRKCEQYDGLCRQKKDMENEHNQLSENYNKVIEDSSILCKQYDELHHEYKQTCDKYDILIQENKNLVEKVNSFNKESANTDSDSKIMVNDSQAVNVSADDAKVLKRLQCENNSLQNENNNLQVEKVNLENYLVSLSEEMNQREEHLKNAEDKKTIMESRLIQIEQEQDMIKTKYDLLRADFEKATREKAHFSLTVESLCEENKKLNEKIHKQCLLSSSTKDGKFLQLQSENESLQEQVEILQTNCSKSNAENRILLDRIKRSDEKISSTLCTLKARKNELQLQVETLKYENDYLKKIPKTKEKKHKFGKSSSEKYSDIYINESLGNALTEMAELQVENGELTHKLQESEGLLHGLQQALAYANDLAMQKNLECSKMKRCLERKVEKLSQENTELRRIIFLLDDSSINHTPPKGSATDPERKSSVVNITFSTETQENSTSEYDQPHLISVSRVSSTHSEKLLPPFSHEPLLADCEPESPRLNSSRQAENDLSLQLRELLDFSDKLCPPDDDQKSHLSEESLAPPVPPPPPNYESSSKGYKPCKQG